MNGFRCKEEFETDLQESGEPSTNHIIISMTYKSISLGDTIRHTIKKMLVM